MHRLSRSLRYGVVVGCLGLLPLAGCDRSAPATAVKPATAQPLAHESELLRLTLTPEAIERLGITLVGATPGEQAARVHVPGEVVIAPHAGGLPVAATTDLATLATAQARADGEVGRLIAELQVAEIAARRAESLLAEGAGSIRLRDEAQAALGATRANLAAARAQRDVLGPPVARMQSHPRRWIRAAVFASDLPRVDRSRTAQVRGLGAAAATVEATPVEGPPSASYAGGSVDLYYAVPAAAPLRLGQRVDVAVPIGARLTGVQVPSTALLLDINGGQWVYVAAGEHAFERRRVEVVGSTDGVALIGRGLAPGARVVAHGAMELFGTEFGSK